MPRVTSEPAACRNLRASQSSRYWLLAAISAPHPPAAVRYSPPLPSLSRGFMDRPADRAVWRGRFDIVTGALSDTIRTARSALLLRFAIRDVLWLTLSMICCILVGSWIFKETSCLDVTDAPVATAHTLAVEEVERSFSTNSQTGLTAAEAKARLARFRPEQVARAGTHFCNWVVSPAVRQLHGGRPAWRHCRIARGGRYEGCHRHRGDRAHQRHRRIRPGVQGGARLGVAQTDGFSAGDRVPRRRRSSMFPRRRSCRATSSCWKRGTSSLRIFAWSRKSGSRRTKRC
jgi:hypothetical protein